MNSNGTFVAVRFNQEVVELLRAYAIANGVPNVLTQDEYHSTIVYSRKHLKNVPSQRELTPHWIGKPIGFDVFGSSKGTNCLVLKIHCPEMNARHNFLRTFEQASHDFPTYNAHITLSYDIGDYDIKQMWPIESVLEKIVIVQEYSMELIDNDRREKAA